MPDHYLTVARTKLVPEKANTAIEANAYRHASETFLRGVDLLNEIAGGDIAYGLVLSALWCQRLQQTIEPRRSLVLGQEWNEFLSIHSLAKALDRPYPTVHRQLATLVRRGVAARRSDGLVTISEDFLNSEAVRSFRRRFVASGIRLLVTLQRVGFISGNIQALEQKNGLSKHQQDIVFRAKMEVMLANLLLTARFRGDLVAGLVFKLVAMASVQHLTGTSAAENGMLDEVPDELRKPITIYGLAQALHLPRETARRVSNKLVSDNIFVRIPNKGVIVPAAVYKRLDDPILRKGGFESLLAGIAQLRSAGLKFDLLISPEALR